jgi:PHD/YefM family antitoxin component YafN of YafNO toxin-antitoxin module
MVKLLKRHDHIIITNHGVGESVLIGIEDYADYEEFLHRRFVFEELQKSKAEAADPSVELRAAADVFGRIRQRIADKSSAEDCAPCAPQG